MDETERSLDGLRSICRYCETISHRMHNFGTKDFHMADTLCMDACALMLLQIGELVKINYSWLRTVSPDFNWTEYARFRDFVAHNYHKVIYEDLWNIINIDVPLIWNEAMRILDDYAGDRLSLDKNLKPRSRLFHRRWSRNLRYRSEQFPADTVLWQSANRYSGKGPA